MRRRPDTLLTSRLSKFQQMRRQNRLLAIIFPNPTTRMLIPYSYPSKHFHHAYYQTTAPAPHNSLPKDKKSSKAKNKAQHLSSYLIRCNPWSRNTQSYSACRSPPMTFSHSTAISRLGSARGQETQDSKASRRALLFWDNGCRAEG
jgi:hypothetical protein